MNTTKKERFKARLTKQILKELENKPKNIRRKFPKGTPHNFKQYITRAEDKNLDFDFNIEEFNQFISKACTYCGAIPANGIDRIDSKIGYTISNSTPCCKYCNNMKYIHSTEFFLNHIKSIYDFNFKKLLSSSL